MDSGVGQRKLWKVRKVTGQKSAPSVFPSLWLSIARRIYLVSGAFGLYILGLLSTAAGHGPYTFLQATGSWFSVLVSVGFFLDDRLFKGATWSACPNETIMIPPIGFLVCYWCTKRIARRLRRSAELKLVLLLHLVGSIVAILSGVLLTYRTNASQADVLFAAVGLAVAGAFVGIDVGLQHWESKRRNSAVLKSEHRICSLCAYDLTGNLSGTCPECGQSTRPPPANSPRVPARDEKTRPV